MHNASVNVGQADITTAESERQLFMMDPKLMQHGGMNVVNLKRIFRDRVSEFIGLAECCSAFESYTREEDAVSVDVVVSSAGF